MRLRKGMSAFAVLLPLGLVTLAAYGGQGTLAKKSGPAGTSAKAASPDAAVSFRKEIEPFLKAKCSGCHSVDGHSSGLNVETPEALLKGGAKYGAKIIVPGKAQESILIAYLRGQKQPRMPYGGPAVAEPQIRLIATWIDQGAKVDAAKPSWPYTPPVAKAVPRVRYTVWVRNPIDNFVLAKLEARGLTPAPPASKSALLRRVYVDLVGILPTPQEADRFLNDPSPHAYEQLVDRLLADPRYGERWARHWLDLVRYADTNGFENDGIRPRAWRYRDYVIDSLNADKPYDRFLKEQLAGDELYPGDADALVATGYARLGPWDEITPDHAQRWQDYLNDATDTTGSVMLGLTVGCARCHNHKYDPISQADYYRMQAFFAGTQWVDAPLPKDKPAFAQKVAASQAQLQALKKQAEDLKAKYRALVVAQKQKNGASGKIEVKDDEINALFDKPENRSDRETRDKINAEIGDIERDSDPYRAIAEVVTDGGKTAPPQHLLLRGNLQTPGPEVQPGFLAALNGGQEVPAVITPPPDGKTTGRRTALANWIASRQNPMTARVIVNRLWQTHFGQGIVGTPSDFGRNGDKPTHPELLDWLAVRFMNAGWSLKKMHRLMVLSATYRQSTQLNPIAAKIDPGNRLLWRMNRIRMEGESLRDSILTLSGRLNPQMGGPGVYPKVSDEVLSTGSTHKWGSSPEDQGLRRTIYVFQRRSLMLPLIEAFDGADMNNTCPRRNVTTIAPQALELFNSAFSREESRYFAQRVEREAGADLDRQIALAYRMALCRLPTAAQKALARAYLQRKTKLYLSERPSATTETKLAADSHDNNMQEASRNAELAALADFCHVLINTNEFVYLN